MFRNAALAATAILACGCGAGWHQPAPVPLGALPARQQVQVWQGGTALRWHAVRVGADSVGGIPFQRPAACDSCRIAPPRAGAHPLRLASPLAGFWQAVARTGGVAGVEGA